ncbi:amino acid ABC transporter ATP-binding protein [Helcococcus ovis]|uniref:Amino acid ABC transporter ATP-binding protein n=1 Tax=Helcococcus ovis TaxID=72026 RepID=A0A4R9C0Q0_9FIRM|nr:amino acid ABC transporter ATP-binding protein [Helcococcus ovis]TFF65507.1 amino acid ABC transporter ATP-binding protein [Helcococcus ovis]TFF65745.1 amino acid ABC transporter ATP-binding protein [Helcococcus ovis]TFF68511.1 amino acid ABC transporter ATP-binding protein [Helcococcus ovis]WNZ01431.1 amino acid ABC transporter ATP-binding protein [Helcococcus ovis]
MLEIKNISKTFNSKVLDNVSFEINKGEIVVIIGPSGSGKSTLLRTMNLLEIPDEGQIYLDGNKISKDTDINQFREKVGMVFQNFNLFSHLTILKNLTLAPVTLKHISEKEANKKALELLDMIGLKDKKESFPNELSGGQKQRIAIIRALMMNPDLILFDEPTSALDPEKVGEVLDLMEHLAKDGMTMAVVTHEMGFAKKVANRIIFVENGKIIEDTKEVKKFFENSENERVKEFLEKIL